MLVLEEALCSYHSSSATGVVIDGWKFDLPYELLIILVQLR
jgi:hypothetical protein